MTEPRSRLRLIQAAMDWMPAATAVVLPLNPRWSAYSLMVWFVFALVHRIFDSTPRHASSPGKLFRWAQGGPLVYYAIWIGALCGTNNWGLAYFDLEVKASLWLLPLLFHHQMTRCNAAQSVRRALWGFLMGCSIYMIWRIGHALGSMEFIEWRYDRLAGPFHPSYIAAYLLVGMWIMPRHSRGRILFLLVAGLLVGLLASKAGWVIASGMLIGEWMWRRWQRRSADAWSLGALGMLLVGAFLGDSGRMQEFIGHWQAPNVSHHMDEAMHAAKVAPLAKGSTAGRMQAWTASWQILAEHPWGVGTGDAQEALMERYTANESDYAAGKAMNAHSAVWQAALTAGWLGGLIWLTWWGGLIRLAWRHRARNTLGLALIVFLNGTIESVLELQQGVVAFTFLSLMLSAQDSIEKPDV